MNNNFEYRYKPSVQPRVTNQFHSGRCWLFASLNVLRYGLQEKYNLEHTFEFSSAYLFFWDKIERSNVFLEGIWSLKDKELDDRYLQSVFTSPDSHLLHDGGYWNYFKNLAEKYGLLPKSVYQDSFNCMVSDYMNENLIAVLNHMAYEIMNKSKKERWTRDVFDEYKQEYMKTIYDLVVTFMGQPPKTFDWQYKKSDGSYGEIKNLTPLKFLNNCVPYDFTTLLTFIHDPRHPEHYFKAYHVEYANNVVGAEPTVFINLPLDVFKKAVTLSQIDNDPVWFACDVTACLDSEDSTMSVERYEFEPILGLDPRYSKEEMLWMKTSVASHAMVICGVDMDEPKEGEILRPKKFRTENSWGINIEMEWHPDEGCWRMTDKWFDKYVFMAVVDIKYLDNESLVKIHDNANNHIAIKPWDAFGTVAMHKGCDHCNHKITIKNMVK